MKKIIVTFFMLIAFSAAYTQENIEDLITRRQLTCPDIYYNATLLILEYYKKGNSDTANLILDFWEKRCETSEQIIRCRILFSIEENTFSEEIYDSTIMRNLIYYKNKFTKNSGHYSQNYYYYYSYRYSPHYVITMNQDNLDDFTIELSKKLLERENLSGIEKFFLRFYSNDFENTFGMLKNEEFNGTKLQKAYLKEINFTKSDSEEHFNLVTGTWIPFDNLNKLGVHPYFGIKFGFQYKRLLTDISLGMRIGKTAHNYQVYKNDSLWNTTHYFGGYVGVDMGLRLFTVKKNSIYLIGGVAYDVFNSLRQDDPDSTKKPKEKIKKNIGSLNLNAGLGYKYHISPYRYVGLDVKYNFLNYKNDNGTDLTGNALTINFLYGFMGDKERDIRLRDLDYK